MPITTAMATSTTAVARTRLVLGISPPSCRTCELAVSRARSALPELRHRSRTDLSERADRCSEVGDSPDGLAVVADRAATCGRGRPDPCRQWLLGCRKATVAGIDGDLRSRVADLFETIRAEVLAAAVAAETPLTTTVDAVAVDRQSETDWSTRTDAITVNAFRRTAGWSRDVLSNAALDEAIVVAGELASAFSAHLPYWSPGIGGPPLTARLPNTGADAFDAAPAKWVAGRALLPAAAAYLRRLPSVAAGDAALRDAAVDELLDMLADDVLRSRVSVAVAGLRTDDEELAAGNVSVRRLSPAKQGEYIAEPVRITARMTAWHDVPAHRLDVTVDGPDNVSIIPPTRSGPS